VSGFLAGLCVAVLPLLAAGFWLGRRTARPASLAGLGTPVEHATFETLHTASLATPPLRAGLTEETAGRSARKLRSLLGTDALCLTDREQVLVWDGAGAHHRTEIMERLAGPLDSGRGEAFPLSCDTPDCAVRWAVVAPLTVDDRVHGALVACAPRESAVLVRAAGEVARWVSVQLELADLDRSRTRLIEAELRALRAQISPHFIFNSLAVIASFVRTDPERARELLVDFADFARYSFRDRRDFTTLAEELRSIHRYLLLERARFGDERLRFSVEIAPEVLPVAVPFLSLQPLVENAIRHGMQYGTERFHVRITARDAGAEAEISVEDDGVGMDPGKLRALLADGGEDAAYGGIGLVNVDHRLRQVYGEEYGLVIETAVGAGMKVGLRVPKSHPGVAGG
jgi:two-component system, LytTR family, sensor kinase